MMLRGWMREIRVMVEGGKGKGEKRIGHVLFGVNAVILTEVIDADDETALVVGNQFLYLGLVIDVVVLCYGLKV